MSGGGATLLRNYARGEWVRGAGSCTSLVHAVTGETIAEASSDGLDFAFMNTDLTVLLHRPPQGEWFGMDLDDRLGATPPRSPTAT